MDLQTKIKFSKQTHNLINYKSNVLLIGSCFSEHIGNQFSYFKFTTSQNPFGILFHPKAIEKFITNSINQKVYDENDVFFQHDRWHCFDAHSKLSSPNKEELLSNLNRAISTTQKTLKQASHLVITLGTSWVYRFLEADSIVANCHKIPQKKFTKEILTVDEISESIEAIISLVKSINPSIHFIFTISPVRHLKDGFIENNQSKSHLIAAVHDVLDPIKNSHYFPSYEIVMDELRDYRFYSEDMIHPNKTAINYVWDKFSNNWIDDNAFDTMQKIDSIQKRKLHKPFNENSPAHLSFLEKLNSDIKLLQNNFPNLSF